MSQAQPPAQPMVNTLAIDDEPLALQVVEGFAGRIPFLNLVGTYDNPFDAQPLLEAGEVDLLFLDIHMPDITGLQFLRSLSNPAPCCLYHCL